MSPYSIPLVWYYRTIYISCNWFCKIWISPPHKPLYTVLQISVQFVENCNILQLHTLKVLNLNLQIGLPTRNLARGPWILSGATRPKPHFRWPDPALCYALLTEKLVKNGSKYVKISGPNPTRAQYGQPEPNPGQKKSGPTQP